MQLEPVTLADAQTGATAQILSGLGFNCFSFRPVVDGEAIEVLWSEDALLSGQGRPSHSGIPILFPFPGRLRGSFLAYEGATYPLGSDDGLGNAIHGFVLNRPWRITEMLPQRTTGEFHASVDEPGLSKRWPGDFRLTVSYELRHNTLGCEIEVHNPGPTRLPFGLGLHPYFRLPLGAGGRPDDCRVTVPTAEYWELRNMLPTGRRLAAADRGNLNAGIRFADMRFDDVFTGLSASDGQVLTKIEDPQSGRTLELIFDAAFRECVIYNPPHREAVCIEPYTCAPDAYELQATGIDAGLRVLNPGEQVRACFEIRVS
ncbi:MAG TPA: aldose 1-epimerase [Pirellulales bacterium]|nr:aldose 1-epimerase [Pirellulales bacterium]